MHLNPRQIAVAAAAVIAGFLAAFAIGGASAEDSTSATTSLKSATTNGAVSVSNLGAADALPSMKVTKTTTTTSTSTTTTQTQTTQTQTQTQTQTPTQTQTQTQTQTETNPPIIEG